jgi:sulfate transport system permease protein
MIFKKKSILPGFGISLGYTLLYLSIIVIIPLSGLFWKSANLTFDQFWITVTTPRVIAAYKNSFSFAFYAALINSVFGLLTAWVLVRYNFPGKMLIDALVDLPFALPTAVAGISLSTLYSKKGWIGKILNQFDIQIAYTNWGILIALIFIGLPFVVRSVQPVLEEFDTEVEEAAMTLGASRFSTIYRIIFPTILPALLSGFVLAFARGLGEYGSVIFISGNIPMVSEIAPLLIIIKLEQYDYAGATSIAVVMLGISFLCFFIINLIQWWNSKSLSKIKCVIYE